MRIMLRVAGSGQLSGFAFVRKAAISFPFAYQAFSAAASFALSPAFACWSTGTASRMCVRSSFVSAAPAAAP